MYYRRLFFLILLTCDVRWHYVYSTRAALLRSHIPHCDRKKYHDGMTHREDCQPHMPKHAQLSSTFAALGNGLPTQRSTPTQSRCSVDVPILAKRVVGARAGTCTLMHA